MFENKDLIIFDLDGTIGDIDADWGVVVQELHKYFLNRGVDWDFSHISEGVNKIYRKLAVGDEVIQELNELFLKYEMQNMKISNLSLALLRS